MEGRPFCSRRALMRAGSSLILAIGLGILVLGSLAGCRHSKPPTPTEPSPTTPEATPAAQVLPQRPPIGQNAADIAAHPCIGATWDQDRIRLDQGSILLDTDASEPDQPTPAVSAAWGDVDGDGYFDLAVAEELPGEGVYVPKVYRNVDGELQPDPWVADEHEATESVAWGDADGDGDLDLAVGNNLGPSRVYRNVGGRLASKATWSSGDSLLTRSMAWADVDNDGDLDLAAATEREPRLYLNESRGGNLRFSLAAWSPIDVKDAEVVAWGDADDDGDLDLAVGGLENRVYLNDGGKLPDWAAWSFNKDGRAFSLAWGDVDGDGDLDLAVGNGGVGGIPDRVYLNTGGGLAPDPIWTSSDMYATSLAWGDGDGDGDLDLAAGGWENPQDIPRGINQIYVNSDGRLASQGASSWQASDDDTGEKSIAWGDADGDGDLDLVVAGEFAGLRLYRNQRFAPTGVPGVMVQGITLPAGFAPADGYALAGERQAVVPITINLPVSDPALVQGIVACYSRDGGGNWQAITETHGLTSVLQWNPAASGFFGQSDNVVLRVVASLRQDALSPSTSVPMQKKGRTGTPKPYPTADPTTHAPIRIATHTFPFRIRGNQVRVVSDTVGVPSAIVYRLPAGRSRGAEAFGSPGPAQRTDSQGYLQSQDPFGVPGLPQRADSQGNSQGQISAYTDTLFALFPITATATYSVFYTSATPVTTGVLGTAVRGPGTQELVISAAHPLMLLNPTVALEWDASREPEFLQALRADLEHTSEILFDWSNGQLALGTVRVYHDAPHNFQLGGWDPWKQADIRIFASNELQPNAAQGGIVPQATTDPLKADIVYAPGQVRMGPTWDRYGDAKANLGEDWARALAHELGHYALYLDDNYIGVSDKKLFISIPADGPDGCRGAMNDPYRDRYSEFQSDASWQADKGCQKTLSQIATGRSDWATIHTVYRWLMPPPGDAFAEEHVGPSVLPLAVTAVSFITPTVALTPTIDNPAVYLSDRKSGQTIRAGPGARAFLFQHDRLIDLGKPTLERVVAHGARPGDRLCVFELAAERSGCTDVEPGTEELQLGTAPGWHPDVRVVPTDRLTVAIQVAANSVSDIPTDTLKAQLFPASHPALAPMALRLDASRGAYRAVYNLGNLEGPALDGLVHVWVESDPQGREIVTDYALGGNPVEKWSNSVEKWPKSVEKWGKSVPRRPHEAPAVSSDGQVTLYGEIPPQQQANEPWFFTLQSATAAPDVPPWATVVGQPYWLAASEDAPSLKDAYLVFNYLGDDVPAGEEAGLQLYFWDDQPGSEPRWNPLPTHVDPAHNTASTVAKGPGLYALMSSLQIALTGRGWHLIGFPARTSLSVSDTLRSIDGNYNIVYGFAEDDATDPWKVYGVGAPEWVNDLNTLEFGQGYWINVARQLAMPLRLKGNLSAANGSGSPAGWPDVTAASAKLMQPTLLTPPAVFYGEVRPGPDFTPEANMPVTAGINSQECGRGSTMSRNGRILYKIKVLASGDPRSSGPACGQPGLPVIFYVGQHPMQPQQLWNNNRAWQFDLRP